MYCKRARQEYTHGVWMFRGLMLDTNLKNTKIFKLTFSSLLVQPTDMSGKIFKSHLKCCRIAHPYCSASFDLSELMQQIKQGLDKLADLLTVFYTLIITMGTES